LSSAFFVSLVVKASAALAVLVLTVAALDRLFPPPLERLADVSTAVVDRTGAPLRLFTTAEGFWRLPVALEEVAPVYLELLVAVEDRRFLSHVGVDPVAVARAVGENLAAGRVVSGASTLTMQVARLLEPRPRSLGGKLLQGLRALQLEARYDKRRILEMYLTLAPFGGNLEGVRAASLAYFGKEPRALTAGEAALLVALPRSPSLLRPDRRPDAAGAARERTLERAVAAGVLDGRAAEEAREEPVPGARVPWPFHAPHLAERLHRERPGEALVRTTLDGRLQPAVEALARRTAASLVEAGSVAVLVADNRDGTLLASVGSAGYFDTRRQGAVDMTRAVRSPGSALKPFVYGLAFDDRIVEPRTLIADVSTRFRDYSPANFDSSFHGELTVRDALLRSLNVPAVLVLDRLGPERFVGSLARVGVPLYLEGYGRCRRQAPVAVPGASPPGAGGGESPPEKAAAGAERASRPSGVGLLTLCRDGGSAVGVPVPGLPVALGGVGTTLEDLTALYLGLARDGVVAPLGVTADPRPASGGRLLSRDAARQVREILRDAAPAPGWVQASDRRTRAPVAVKTGTSYGFRDAWAFGVGEGYTVGVWVGRPDGTPVPEQTGRTAALPLLYEVFDLLPSSPGVGVKASLPSAPPAPMLRRLEARAAGEGLRLPDDHRLRLVFPRPGIGLEVSDGEQGLAPVTLIAEGGRRPLVWMVDGRPVAQGAEREVLWQPPGTGRVRVSVVDADGRSDSATLTLR
jgi:penicillin-binding protein 1C